MLPDYVTSCATNDSSKSLKKSQSSSFDIIIIESKLSLLKKYTPFLNPRIIGVNTIKCR